MARREIEALKAAVEAAKKVVRKPIIDDSQGEPDAPRSQPQAPGQS